MHKIDFGIPEVRIFNNITKFRYIEQIMSEIWVLNVRNLGIAFGSNLQKIPAGHCKAGNFFRFA